MKMRLLNRFVVMVALPWLLVACEPPNENNKATPRVTMTVYQSPGCGCCEKWVAPMSQAGFTPDIRPPQALDSIKAQYGIGDDLRACHTTLIDGYVFEGHIPADDIKRFLQEKPADAKGLVVPKMPQGSPGMDMVEKREPYQVLLIRHDGSRQIYAQH